MSKVVFIGMFRNMLSALGNTFELKIFSIALGPSRNVTTSFFDSVALVFMIKVMSSVM